MEPSAVPDTGPIAEEAAAEGRAWCPRCDRETAYTLVKVEFLGNPVKVSFLCVHCGGRMDAAAVDRESARRLRASARWLRTGAAGYFFLMLLFPLLLAAVGLYCLWLLL